MDEQKPAENANTVQQPTQSKDKWSFFFLGLLLSIPLFTIVGIIVGLLTFGINAIFQLVGLSDIAYWVSLIFSSVAQLSAQIIIGIFIYKKGYKNLARGVWLGIIVIPLVLIIGCFAFFAIML